MRADTVPLETLATLRRLLAESAEQTQRRVRSTDGIQVQAQDAPGGCPACGGAMRVKKTSRRRGTTLAHGQFLAHQTVTVCAAGCPGRYGTEALNALLPPVCRQGYDVMVFVGLARFVRHQQRLEIQEALRSQHGIELSSGEISVLGRRFLVYLEALHESRAPQLREALDKDGGWPLHVDATGEDGRGTLLVAFAGWRRWVLGAWKVPTERSDVILPRLQGVVKRFGPPCAMVRDLGRAVTEACDELAAELAGDVPVLACHLHLLKDVGEDILQDAHDRLRGLFRRFEVKPRLRTLARDLGRALGTQIETARQQLLLPQDPGQEGHVLPGGPTGLATVRALAQWVLDYGTDGRDEGFPFDLPYLHLHDRCREASRAADAFLRRPPEDRCVQRALERLRTAVAPVESEVPFSRVAVTLRSRDQLFTELREAMRLRPKPSGRNGPPPAIVSAQQAAAELSNIQAALGELTVSLKKRRPERGPAQDRRQAIDVVLAHLDRHKEYLFGHVLPRPACLGGGLHLVDRTNNALEGLFHALKHDERRRSGRKVLTQDLEQLPPAAALAINLDSPDYVAILAGSLENLPAAFAALDASNTRRSAVVAAASRRSQAETECDVVSASLPRVDRRIVRHEALSRRIKAAARSRAPRR